MKNFSKFLPVLLFLGLFGCSTDDDPIIDQEEEEEVPTALTGVFNDLKVSGLAYSTETQEGVTNADGEFQYLQDETVTFSVGAIELGSVVGAAELDLASIAATENPTADSEEVKNMMALLMSLDSDNDPSNGIRIDSEVAEAISSSSINFSQSIIKALGEILAEIYQVTGISLEAVYPEEAAAQMAELRGETYESEDLVFSNFIPFIESYNNDAPNSFHWIHETDATGKLVTSYKYEKIPYNLNMEYTYLEHNELGLPTKINREETFFGGQTSTSTLEMAYTEEGGLESLTRLNEDGSLNQKAVFVEFDEENRVLVVNNYLPDGSLLLRQKYVYDGEGNPSLIMRSFSESGGDDSFIGTRELTFNENGDILKSVFTQGDYIQITENSYRSDGTLERSESSGPSNSIVTYDEDELRLTAVVTSGNYRTDWFYENGNPTKAETYFNDFLYEIITYNEDGSTEWKTIDQEDLSYKIEYKNADGSIYKTEYYDAEGNLLSTE